jgi:hypothetical protein
MIRIYKDESPRGVCPRKVLVHFLDHEILRSFGVDKKSVSRVLDELQFAFRVGILLALDGVVLPASHRFESAYAGRILERHKIFAEFGFVNLASNTVDIAAFFQQKQQQYSINPQRHPLYFEKKVSEIESESIARWIIKTRNSTEDIVADWLESIGNANTWGNIYPFSNVSSISRFEYELVQVPERLEENAFIGDFVVPLLPLKSVQEPVTRHINVLIQRAYINSFLKSYEAVCLNDLPLFDTSILLPADRPRYSVSRAKRYFYRSKKLKFIESSDAEQFFKYKLSDAWSCEWEQFCTYTCLNPGFYYTNGNDEPIYMKDFFISYNQADRSWAEWIAWQLEEAGYTTVIQAWDFRPGSNFVLEMDKAAKETKSTITVLSQDYLDALYTHPEWTAAFARDPKGEKGTLLPVLVRECELKGLLAQVIYINLMGLEEGTARDRLLVQVRRGRAKPIIMPGFPGARHHSVLERPCFPGALPPVRGESMKHKQKHIKAIEKHLNECVETLEACYEDTLGGAVLKLNAKKKIKEVNELIAQREDELLSLLTDMPENEKYILRKNLSIARNPDSSEKEKAGAKGIILSTVEKIRDKIIDVGGDVALKLIMRSVDLDSE